MQISKVTIIASLAGAIAWQLHAQPASPELQNKALELLRQTLSQSRQSSMDSRPGKPASSDQQQQAIDLLRQRIAQENSAAPQPAMVSKPVKAATGSTVRPTPKSPSAPAPAMAGATPPAPEPAGPRTKQQRLMDLLDQYKADKISPSEYHAQRAKILAEP